MACLTVNSQSLSLLKRGLWPCRWMRCRCPLLRWACSVFRLPFHGFAVFFGVVDAFRHAADDLGHVDRFVAHAEIFLEEVGIDHRSGDAHRYAAHREIRFAAHRGHSLCGACEAEYLLGYVGGYGVVVKILHVVTVDAECLSRPFCEWAASTDARYTAPGLCAVEAPDSLSQWGFISIVSPP